MRPSGPGSLALRHGQASSSKKVARAAGIGGGRTNRGKAPVLWYGTLVLILLAGVGLTAFSRNQRLDELGSPSSKEEPRAGATHWHVALGVKVCDKWLEPIQDSTDPKGIHTHGDGIIHIHPSVAAAAGRRATFERFAEAVKGELAATEFSWPDGATKKKETHKNGDKCGDQEGEVKAFYNGELHKGDPSEIRFTDRGRLVLAFVPKDATYEQIGDPPSTPGLDKLSDVDPAAQQKQSQVVDPAGATVDPTVSGSTTPAGADPTAVTPSPAAGPDPTAPGGPTDPAAPPPAPAGGAAP
ncbi:MAG: hypothetical protein ABIS47_07735 [Acidimicrobiales bacterium]